MSLKRVFPCFLLILIFGFPATWASNHVEIYAMGKKGTQTEPLESGFWATFSCRVNGIECTVLSPSLEWRTNPQLTFRFTDLPEASFQLPSNWVLPTQFQVILTIHDGNPGAGEHTKVFWAAASSGGGSGGGGGGNRPPEIISASASPSSASFGQTITLTGSARDPDGDPLTYRWWANTTAGVLGGKGTLIHQSTSIATATHQAPNFSTTVVYTFEVTDGVSVVSQAVQVSVGAGGGATNPPPPGPSPQQCQDCGSVKSPQVDAGPPTAQVVAGQSLQLNGTWTDRNLVIVGTSIIGSSSNIVKEWSITDNGGLSGLTLTNANQENATLVTPASIAQDTTVQLQFRVTTDGCGCADTMTVQILKEAPKPNKPPVASAVASKTQVSIGEKVTLDASASKDDDGDPLTYTWSAPQGIQLAPETSNQSKVSFVAPDVQTDTTLNFTVTVSDGKATATQNLQVVVRANRAPKILSVVSSAGPELSVPSGAEVTLTATAQDDDGDPLTYAWSRVSGPEVQIQDGNKASASFVAPTVLEDATLVLKVTVSDGKTSVERTISLAIRAVVLNSLVFPVSAAATGNPLLANTFVGVAVVNPNPAGNQLTIFGAREDGAQGTSVQPPGLSPQGQAAFLTVETPASEDATALVVKGSQGPIQGFFMVGDFDLNRLDGIGGKLEEAKTLYFPLARHSDLETTLLFLFNPNESDQAEVTLSLYGKEGGDPLRQVTALLPVQGSILKTLDQIFAQEGETFVVEEGYVQVDSTVAVKGFEFLVKDTDLSSMAAQIPQVTKDLFVPHFFIGRTGDTEIRLLNANPGKMEVTLKAFDDGFTQVGKEIKFSVGGKQLYIGKLSELLEVDRSQLGEFEFIQGHLRLRLVGGSVSIFPLDARVVGSVTFFGNGGQFRSTLPMIRSGEKETLFLHVAQSFPDDIFTGFAILHPGDPAKDAAVANVKLQAFDVDGKLKAEIEFQLEPGKRRIDLLDGLQFFGQDFAQIGGHIRLTSDVPVLAFSLFGDYNSRYLSAIEGQPRTGK